MAFFFIRESSANEPRNNMRTRIITRVTARKGISCRIIPTACANEISISPVTRAMIASICFLSSPKIFAFCRTAKTIVKTRRNGRIVSTNTG